ncbi:MAG TPA: hypothetical protein DD670_20835 [Planctomycetaceae bacterium]|nr:hypothetical protein [Planctomycetaceae bacterium]
MCLTVIVGASGCDGNPDTVSQEELELARQAQKERMEKEQAEEKKARDEAAALNQRRPAATAAEAAAARQPPGKRPRRPKDFGDWRRVDYFDAKEDRDPRFVEAVEYIGEHFPDNSNAATTLVELLRAETATSELTPRRLRPCRPNEIRAIIVSLARNRTETAREALRQLATGRLPTDDDAAALEVVLSLAVAQPSAESESLLFDALTASWPSPDGAATNRAKQRRDQAVQKLLRSGVLSVELRSRLAEFVRSEPSSSPYRDLILDCLVEPAPANVPAQIALLEAAELTAVPENAIVPHLAVFRSCELSRLLELSPRDGTALGYRAARGRDVRASLSNAWHAVEGLVEFDPDVAAALHSERLVHWTTDRLYRVHSLADEGVVVVLASTLPTTEARRSLREALVRNWPDGPAGLRDAGLPDAVVSEPGFLVELKSASLHWNSLSGKKNAAGRSPGPRRRMPTGPSAPTTAPNDPWIPFIDDVATTFQDRLCDAAQRREALARNAGRTIETIELPVALHPNARVVHRYYQSWAAGQGTGAAAFAPTTVHFVRCHETAVPEEIVKHYRQLKLPTGALDENRVWLTDLVVDEKAGTRRTIDVTIERMTSGNTLAPGMPEKLQVSVLIVQTADE